MMYELPSKFKIEFGDVKYQVTKDLEYSIINPINGCPFKDKDSCKASCYERGCVYKTTCCSSCKYTIENGKPCLYLCQRLKIDSQHVFKVLKESTAQ